MALAAVLNRDVLRAYGCGGGGHVLNLTRMSLCAFRFNCIGAGSYFVDGVVPR